MTWTPKSIEKTQENIAQPPPEIVKVEPTPLPPQLPVIKDKKPVYRAQKHSPTATELKVREIASAAGYTPLEVDNLITLLRIESGVNPNAVNATSHACGLFQRLHCPWEITQENGEWKVNASVEQQMENGLAYVKNRYGTSTKALQFQLAHGWY